jgi:hypothetical protein
VTAIFSPDRVYRYALYREWAMPEDCREGYAMFIGLNPSTADETNDDPTIRRCRGFAKAWGFRQMWMLNLFAFRATQPKDMMSALDPIGPENDAWLIRYASEGFVVAAWGRNGEFMQRDKRVMALLKERIHQIGEAEYPRHPLYLKGDLIPIEVGRERGGQP